MDLFLTLSAKHIIQVLPLHTMWVGSTTIMYLIIAGRYFSQRNRTNTMPGKSALVIRYF